MLSSRRKFLRTVALGSATLATSGKIQAGSKLQPAERDIVIVPDLQDGFMVINHDGVINEKLNENRWYTPVECVLARRTPGKAGEERAYLCHECRAELVGVDPFSHEGEYEWVGVSTWAGNFAIRSGPGLASDRAYNPMPNDMTIKVSCPDRKARRLSFEEVLLLLQSDFKGGYQEPHLAATYRHGGFEYTLYAPSRYINFPHPVKGVRSYLQPISGYVLFEQDGRFHTAYVVSWIEEGLTRSLQFKVRDQISYGNIVTHDFNRTVKINDDQMQVEFFIYDNA